VQDESDVMLRNLGYLYTRYDWMKEVGNVLKD
jgi:hypothetical protein